jgi:hypothetical protein
VADRCEAARRDCFDSATREAVRCGSRLRARDTARETRGRRRVFRLPWPASYAYSALLRVFAFALPFPGGRSGTPARLALDRPIATTCCGDLAPCWPRRTLRISSCTNSPACVVGDLPARLSRLAFCTVLRSGMIVSSTWFLAPRNGSARGRFLKILTSNQGKWSHGHGWASCSRVPIMAPVRPRKSDQPEDRQPSSRPVGHQAPIHQAYQPDVAARSTDADICVLRGAIASASDAATAAYCLSLMTSAISYR